MILFVFNLSDEAGEDPWDIVPKMINENVADIAPNELVNSPKVIENKKNDIASANTSPSKYPLTKSNSINLDDDIQIPSNRIGNSGEARLAGANNGSQFDGFFIREIEKNKKNDTTNVGQDSTFTKN
jgi:hypothetical protein